MAPEQGLISWEGGVGIVAAPLNSHEQRTDPKRIHDDP